MTRKSSHLLLLVGAAILASSGCRSSQLSSFPGKPLGFVNSFRAPKTASDSKLAAGVTTPPKAATSANAIAADRSEAENPPTPADKPIPTRLASFQQEGKSEPQPAEPIPAPAGTLAKPESNRNDTASKSAITRLDSFAEELGPATNNDSIVPLQLNEVMLSVTESFPLIQAALVEGTVADGKQIAAFGEFDVKLKAESLNMPQGFYKNYRHLVKAEQGTWMGGTVFGQYRMGDGDFQPWYGERETNEGGEVKVGLAAPLLRDRQIDERRTELLKANLARAAVEPGVQEQILDSIQVASNVYWSWVAAGEAYRVNRELLDLTRERNEAIEKRVKKGDLPLVELQQNERLIATREAKLIESQRKVQSSAIKLSIFYRDAEGRPLIPSASLLPKGFPPLTAPVPNGLQSDIDRALTQRPELRTLSVLRQQVELDLDYNQNQLLPNLTAVVDASKDTGEPASTKGDKTPFELEAGLLFDMPVQRRKALGKIQSAQGKITQIAWKQQLTENKIRAEVQDTVSALIAAYERVGQLERSLEFAKRLVDAERRSFELGNSDLLRVALQEAAALDAQLLTIEAIADYFKALADYRAALGEQPLAP